MANLKKIVSNLWFNTEAENAAKYYTSIFKNSSIGRISYYTKAGQEIHKHEPGSVMTVEFTLEDESFVALNGGTDFKFSEAISFVINCDTQDEIDYYWNKLSEGGDPKAQQCGWLKDKYGLSWQVVPKMLSDIFSNADQHQAEKIMEVMMQMKKLNIAELEATLKEGHSIAR